MWRWDFRGTQSGLIQPGPPQQGIGGGAHQSGAALAALQADLGEGTGGEMALALGHPHEPHRHADHQGRGGDGSGLHQLQQPLQGRGGAAHQHHRARVLHQGPLHARRRPGAAGGGDGGGPGQHGKDRIGEGAPGHGRHGRRGHRRVGEDRRAGRQGVEAGGAGPGPIRRSGARARSPLLWTRRSSTSCSTPSRPVGPSQARMRRTLSRKIGWSREASKLLLAWRGMGAPGR